MKKTTVMVLMVALLGTAGCTSKPSTFGSRVAAEGESRMGLAQQWEKGSKDVAAGNDLVKRGKRRVAEGKSEISKGESEISRGEKLIKRGRAEMKDAEKRYEPKKEG